MLPTFTHLCYITLYFSPSSGITELTWRNGRYCLLIWRHLEIYFKFLQSFIIAAFQFRFRLIMSRCMKAGLSRVFLSASILTNLLFGSFISILHIHWFLSLNLSLYFISSCNFIPGRDLMVVALCQAEFLTLLWILMHSHLWKSYICTEYISCDRIFHCKQSASATLSNSDHLFLSDKLFHLLLIALDFLLSIL